jgi:hypothetical protein
MGVCCVKIKGNLDSPERGVFGIFSKKSRATRERNRRDYALYSVGKSFFRATEFNQADHD